jgi:hypothetical protein
VVADGLVIVTSYFSTGGQRGEIEAFPEVLRTPQGLSCRPVWQASVSYDDSMGLTVDDGMVFVNTLMGFTGSARAGHQPRAGDSVPVAAGG